MKNNKIINVLLVVIMILVVIACIVAYMYFTQEKVEVNETNAIFTLENYPRIDGSTSTLPLAEAFKANFTGTNIDEVEVNHSRTHNAYVNLINGDTDLILVTYPSEDEQKLAEENGIDGEQWNWRKYPFNDLVDETNMDIKRAITENWNDIPDRIRRSIVL